MRDDLSSHTKRASSQKSRYDDEENMLQKINWVHLETLAGSDFRTRLHIFYEKFLLLLTFRRFPNRTKNLKFDRSL